MEITYFGLNAIRIRGRDATLLIDPYEPKLGLAPVRLNVQIVALTHDDPTQFSMQGLGSDYHLVTGAGEFEIKGIFLRGIQTYHDGQKGQKRGKNFVYVVEVDDLRVCHLGHLGHALDEGQLDAIGSKIDVLCVPVGGGSHIGSAQATEIVNQIEPKLVIPISYRLPGLTLLAQDLEPVDKFAKEMGATDLTTQPKLQLSSSPTQEEPKLVLLEARGAAAAANVD
ncbi:MAG TPA: MBL fold metallo-hydrolase [Candidatus Limnocylindrales bacterium]|nr:MBL fold metallo-hydrolase [Candidatus Limnocylindrales bacterium]